MCGINGFNFTDTELLKKMNQVTKHRGPDFSGIFINENISLGHNLLSIREVSDISKQPYVENTRYAMVFNGQIYNTQKIIIYLESKGVQLDETRKKLDTYLIYKLLELEGINFVEHIFGMFSLAIYDTETKKIYLCRDSGGQKNLYYYFDETSSDKKLIFSSEIKGILVHNGLDRAVDESSVQLATALGYIPGNKTLFAKIKKVEPGQVVEFDIDTHTFQKHFFTPATKDYFTGDFAQVMKDLVMEHLQSKDKISINLSGGLDSSLLLHEIHANKYSVNSYTTFFDIIGDNKNYNDDALLARRLSVEYQTNHTEIKITKDTYLQNFEEAYKTVEEPNYNISLPVYLITAKTEGIHGDGQRVVLSGDGGDEVFAGYPYYLQNKLIDQKIQRFTPPLYELIRFVRAILKRQTYISNSSTSTRWYFFKDLKKHFVRDFQTKSILAYLKSIYINYTAIFKKKNDSIYTCMLADRVFWLASENFIRSDKLYMSQSMELRNPLSYEPFREYCDQLIPNDKYIDETNNKLFLREYAEKVLPEYIIRREKKSGWRAPIDIWYDSDYKKLFLKIITEAKQTSSGIILWDEVLKRIEEKEGWPGKWVHVYLSLAILSKEFNLKL